MHASAAHRSARRNSRTLATTAPLLDTHIALPSELRDRLTLPAFAAPMFLCSGVEGDRLLPRRHRRLAHAQPLPRPGGIAGAARARARSARSFRRRSAHAHDRPLAVNISPTFSADEFRDHLDLCRRHGARIVVTSVGDPTAHAPRVHDAGLLHFHDATTIRFAEKAVAAGVDGIVCIGVPRTCPPARSPGATSGVRVKASA